MHSKVREADLLKTQAILVALTGILVLCGQIGPTAVDARQTAIQRVAGIKGDRLDAPRAVPLADSFATSVLFRADSLTGAPVVAKPAPAVPSRRSEEPQVAPVKRALGCEAAVSPLVRQQAASVPGRCLA
jgi:hypothetical protein